MIVRITILGLILSSVLYGAFHLSGKPAIATGVLAGGILETFNLTLITFAVQNLLKSTTGALKSLLVLIFVGKFIFLGAVIFLMIAKFHIDGLGIIIGITAIMIFLVWVGIIRYTQLKKKGATWQAEE